MALHKIDGLTGMSVSDVRGFGRTRAQNAPDRITHELVDFVPMVKIEIVCEAALVADIVHVIQQTAHTGLRGDGKIYVTGVEGAVRISTAEEGEAAI
jgi:nitrogen regulatory protein P-II 1